MSDSSEVKYSHRESIRRAGRWLIVAMLCGAVIVVMTTWRAGTNDDVQYESCFCLRCGVFESRAESRSGARGGSADVELEMSPWVVIGEWRRLGLVKAECKTHTETIQVYVANRNEGWRAFPMYRIWALLRHNERQIGDWSRSNGLVARGTWELLLDRLRQGDFAQSEEVLLLVLEWDRECPHAFQAEALHFATMPGSGVGSRTASRSE